MTKCCIIYWGLLRGFKFDFVYESHREKIYNYLDENNIEYEIYIVTNNIGYDDTQVKKLNNVKKIEILNIEDITKTDLYKNLIKNFNFDGHFQDESKMNLGYCFYNRKYIMNDIPDDYDFYISLDIQHFIEKFDFLDLCKYKPTSSQKDEITEDMNIENISILSNYHKQLGVNPRVFIGKYNNTKIYNSIMDYALLGNYSHNPESLLKQYLEVNNINLVETNDILIHRVRECGTILKDN